MDCREAAAWVMGIIGTTLVLLLLIYSVWQHKTDALQLGIEQEKTRQAWIETIKDWDGKVLIIPSPPVEE